MSVTLLVNETIAKIVHTEMELDKTAAERLSKPAREGFSDQVKLSHM